MKKISLIIITILMFFFKNAAHSNYEKIFFDLKTVNISGEIIDFSIYKNKAVLVVNTASFCGFTKQYEDLQTLWEKYESKGSLFLGFHQIHSIKKKEMMKKLKSFVK